MDRVSGPASVVTIDCLYLSPKRAAAYLLVEGNHAVFIDNNTSHAVLTLLSALGDHGLRPEQVDYLIVTHVHLDHAGGTSVLLDACPRATVIAHPRAARHLADPSRLVTAVKSLYGAEFFGRTYGTVRPVPADRIRTVEDGETLTMGGCRAKSRALTFLHTLGHAKHHICIHDSESNGVFTGDAFGVARPSLQRGTRPYVICSCPPPDFEPAQARTAVARILATDAQRVYLTHFGELTCAGEAADELLRSIDAMDGILKDAIASGLRDQELHTWCRERVMAALVDALQDCGVTPTDEDLAWLQWDAELNGQGIAHAAATPP